MVCGEVVCDAGMWGSFMKLVVCGEFLCDRRYVVKFYVMGGMW